MSATRSHEWRMPPGLRFALPFYAHKPWVKFGEPILLFEHLHRTYGRIAHYRFMGTPIVFVNDPAWIQEILVTQASSFVKERTVRRMKILLGEGLITSDDPIHMQHRRIVAPAFHRQRIAAYAEQIVASAKAHCGSWHSEQELDISSSMMELSLEIVARTLFNTEVTDDIRRINDEVNTIMEIYNYLVAFPRLEAVLALPIPLPFPRLNGFRRSRAQLDEVVQRLIAEHRVTGVDRGDLLSMLIASRDEDGAALSDAQIRDEVLTIFLAGYETTANALTWTWYLLSQNPQAESKLHEELDRVLRQESGVHRLPTLEDYPQLRYTEQVFAESMRLYPPAWAMGRMSTAPVTLGPYRIPAGAHFFMSQYMVSRTEEYFPDPLRFDPERFSPENKSSRPRFAYFPFGGGSRQCIGESFAWMEGVLAIATIASRWMMRHLDDQPPVPQAKITLRPRDAVRMRVESRGPVV